MVYKLERHFRSVNPQKYRHIDASLLGFYDSPDVVKENLSELAYLRRRYNQNWRLIDENKKEFWFDNLNQLPAGLFDKLTIPVVEPGLGIERDQVTLERIAQAKEARSRARVYQY